MPLAPCVQVAYRLHSLVLYGFVITEACDTRVTRDLDSKGDVKQGLADCGGMFMASSVCVTSIACLVAICSKLCIT